MVDISSRDEEEAREREMEREKGRREEQDKARERELATEKGHKQGLEEGRAQQEKVRKEESTAEREREQATEKGRKQEHDLQRERELAAEKGRKQGLEEERSRQKGKGGMGSGAIVVIALVVILLVVALAAYLSLSTTVSNVEPGNALPYTTMYSVSFPEGKIITIGNSHITVLSYQGELISDIDGDRQKLVVGEDRVITERRAVATTLGALKLMDTNFVINLKYKGDRDNQAYFDMAVHTSKQVPDMLIQRLLPPEIDARPM
jgi:hypothetical protein